MSAAGAINYSVLARKYGALENAESAGPGSVAGSADYDALAAQHGATSSVFDVAREEYRDRPEEDFLTRTALGAGRGAVGLGEFFGKSIPEAFTKPAESGTEEFLDAIDPFNTMLAAKRILVDPQVETGKRAWESAKSGAPLAETLGRAGAAALPVFGPMAAHLGEEIGAGDLPGALGEGLVNFLPVGAAARPVMRGASKLLRGRKGAATPTPTGKIGGVVAPDPFDVAVLEAHQQFGGSTFDAKTGKNLLGTRNYAVSVFPELAQVFDRPITPEDIARFRNDPVRAELLQHPNVQLGTWKDTSTGKHWLELTGTTRSRPGAISLGERFNQKQVFGLQSAEEIPTGGTGEPLPDMPLIPERLTMLEQSSPARTTFAGRHFSEKPVKEGTLTGARRGSSGIGEEGQRLALGARGSVPGNYVYDEGTRGEPRITSRSNEYRAQGQFALADIANESKPEHKIWMDAYRREYDAAKVKKAGHREADGLGANAAEWALFDAGYEGYYNSVAAPNMDFLFGDTPVQGVGDAAAKLAQKPAQPEQTSPPPPAAPAARQEMVGTTEGAARDTALFQQARTELGENADLHALLKRAQELKTAAPSTLSQLQQVPGVKVSPGERGSLSFRPREKTVQRAELQAEKRVRKFRRDFSFSTQESGFILRNGDTVIGESHGDLAKAAIGDKETSYAVALEEFISTTQAIRTGVSKDSVSFSFDYFPEIGQWRKIAELFKDKPIYYDAFAPETGSRHQSGSVKSVGELRRVLDEYFDARLGTPLFGNERGALGSKLNAAARKKLLESKRQRGKMIQKARARGQSSEEIGAKLSALSKRPLLVPRPQSREDAPFIPEEVRRATQAGPHQIRIRP